MHRSSAVVPECRKGSYRCVGDADNQEGCVSLGTPRAFPAAKIVFEISERWRWSVADGPKVKTILGYDIVPDVSVEDYKEWLWNIHYPDLLANPYLDKIVLNTMVRPINTTSAGTPIMEVPETFYAIAEMHYADMEAYENYLRWFVEHPIPVERSPAGRSEFKFYVLCEVEEATR